MDKTDDLTLWPILQRLSDEFLSIIDRFFIFNNGESCLLFCRDGKVYGFGQNIYGMLGIQSGDLRERYLNILRFHCYHLHPVLDQPKELTKLRFKNIINVSKGDKHIMALTEMGDLYGWGANFSGQLGIGWYRTCSLEPTLILQEVQKVCCGPRHTVALIYDGSIRLWGKFPGCPHNFTPGRLISAPRSSIGLISTKLLTIAYNNNFDENDKSAFYAWGDLKLFGMSGSSSLRLTYNRCDYNRIFKIIPLGFNKILVLTYEGKVSIISIQNEQAKSIRNPFRGMEWINFCTDIPDDPNVVIMTNKHGQCYLWDERRPLGENLFKTNLFSIPDAACLYSSAFTPDLIKLPLKIIKNQEKDGESKNLKNQNLKFNDPTYSDLEFRFKKYQYKPIYVHKFVLMQHSSYFKQTFHSMAANQSTPTVIVIEDNSYISMFYYLRYIYTKQICLNNFDDLLFSEIYDIAAKYEDKDTMDKIVEHLYFNKHRHCVINEI